MNILVLNSGSSSLKYQLMDMEKESVLAKGVYERIGIGDSVLTHKVDGNKHIIEQKVVNHEEAIKIVLDQLLNSEYGVISSLDEINAIGHRMVHGGEKINSSVVIDDEVIKIVEDCTSLAPLHNPAGLTGVRACRKVMPGKPMVGVFDTAFHQTMPKEHYMYPIPYEYYEKYGIRKYGFHGTSHNYVSSRIAELMNKDIKDLKIINCHIGQGASICAIQNGKCIDTSMGLTPLGGIMMGTRSGDMDPAVVTYIMEKEKLTPTQMDQILNKKSGLLGLSGVSADNRDIEAAIKDGNTQAKAALDEYIYIIAQYIGKYAVAMKGVDVITFTAGVGENAPETRKEICDYLGFMGVKIDDSANDCRGKEIEISTNDSKIKVWVVPTDEELMIARETLKLVK